MTNSITKVTKIQQANAYVEQKLYERDVIDRNLDGLVSDDLVLEVMNESDFMLQFLIDCGHNRADLVRVGGL